MATKPVDFRRGVNGQAALIKDEIGANTFSGVEPPRVCRRPFGLSHAAIADGWREA
jgi:hypothetical protein